MNEEVKTPDPSQFPKYQKRDIFASLPAYLKDPANYYKIQKVVLNALSSTHSHGEVLEWAACVKCQARFYERGAVIQGLGFSGGRQYMMWKKVMEMMINPKRNKLI